MCYGVAYFLVKALHHFSLSILSVFGADFRRDGEARRHGHTQQIHFGQIGAFAAQEIAHRGFAFSFAVSKRVDSFHWVGF